jgi:hypothetical protein
MIGCSTKIADKVSDKVLPEYALGTGPSYSCSLFKDDDGGLNGFSHTPCTAAATSRGKSAPGVWTFADPTLPHQRCGGIPAQGKPATRAPPWVRRPIAVRPIGALGTFGGHELRFGSNGLGQREQETHHRTVSLQEEFRAFLARYEVEYDERYVWDGGGMDSGLATVCKGKPADAAVPGHNRSERFLAPRWGASRFGLGTQGGARVAGLPWAGKLRTVGAGGSSNVQTPVADLRRR